MVDSKQGRAKLNKLQEVRNFSTRIVSSIGSGHLMANSNHIKACKQLVLSKQCHPAVLQVAHDVPTAGHLGINKTRSRILHRIYRQEICMWGVVNFVLIF